MARNQDRVTLKDIAHAAGVGVATVDRVINGRAPVTPETAARVMSAAEDLGFHAQRLMRQRLAALAPVRKLGFILQKENKRFYRRLAEELSASAASLTDVRATAEISFVGSLSPDDLAQEIRRVGPKVDALGVVAIEHPKVTDAITGFSEGIPVFSLLSPISSVGAEGYIGIDGRKAGRTAGWAMARLVPKNANVGLLIGSHRYLGHEALEAGFRGYMREIAPSVTVRDSVVYLDDREVAYEAASELIAGARDLKGIYHAGGGTSGVVRALEESGRTHEIVYVCHELGPETALGLQDGTVDFVLETPVKEIAVVATRAMAAALRQGRAASPPGHVAFRLFTPENL
ncbi:MAG: LacI family DNA-binding transcriptional regulator [Pseudomonadota bacterium]